MQVRDFEVTAHLYYYASAEGQENAWDFDANGAATPYTRTTLQEPTFTATPLYQEVRLKEAEGGMDRVPHCDGQERVVP